LQSDSHLLEGKVVRLHGHHAWIRVPDGREIMCAVRGGMKKGKRRERSPVVVGDDVNISMVTEGPEPEGRIETLAERRTELYRAHPRFPRQRQVLAANIDLLMIVLGANRLDAQLVTADRLMISAFSQGLEPVLVVNKLDLTSREKVSDAMRAYAGTGVDIEYVRAASGELGTLPARFAGKSAVFAGPSGVGKSSLMNALEPGLKLRVGEVDREGEGRHTTTFANLVPLAGGLVIDTPGVRDFGFWNLELHEISLYYPDWEQARQQCRFNTCTHRHEPGCGVKAGVENGELDEGRYERYLSILKDTWNEQQALEP
jgi:ribosome biogenesis GTPase / thiamine phosphate phosphatase